MSAPQKPSFCAQQYAHKVDTALGNRGLPRETVSLGPNNSPDLHSCEECDDGEAVLLAVAGTRTPDDAAELVADIAAWYNQDGNRLDMRQSRSYTLRDGLWRYGELIIVPEDYELRRRCIAMNHDLPSAGHPGRNTTLELLQRHFWWPSVRRDVFKYIATCTSCQVNKASTQRPAGLLKPLLIPEYPWQSMSMDLIIHLPKDCARPHCHRRLCRQAHQNGSHSTQL